MITILTVEAHTENILPKLTKRENGWYSGSDFVENTSVSSYEFYEYKGQAITAYKENGTGSFYIHFFDENKDSIARNFYSMGVYGEAHHTVDSATIPRETKYMVFIFWNNHVNPKVFVEGQSYPASSIVNKKSSVNGEDTLSLQFLFDEINADFIADLDFNWKATFEGEKYTLVNPSLEAITKKQSVTAILSFFTDLNGIYLQDEVEDKSMTALNAYTELFAETGKRVHLVDSFRANTLNYQKNQTVTDRFHYYNERFKAEFEVRGDDVYLYQKIGVYKPDVRIDEELNVKDATVEKDTESFFTWCKCFFDLEGSESGVDENYQQEMVYRNEAMIDVYGEIEGPAIYQGNIQYEDVMLEYAADVQANSYSVSHSVSLVDLKEQGYGEFEFYKGDVIRLSLKSINQTVDIRIIDKNETFSENEFGDWIRTDLQLTLGNERVVDAYKRSRTDSLINLEDWLSGRQPIPFSILPSAAQRAADIILGDTDSVMEYRKDKMTGHHSKNEGNNITVNVSGLVLFRKGEPKTAITYEGITADVVNTGQLNTHNVSIFGQNDEGDIITIDGSMFKVWNVHDTAKYVEITKGELHIRKGGFRLTGFDERVYFADGLMRGAQIANIQQFNLDSFIYYNGRDMELTMEENEYHRVYVLWDEYKGRFLDLTGTSRLTEDSAHVFRWVDIRITELGVTGNVATLRTEARKTFDSSVTGWDLRIDLQEYFGVVPDYRKIRFYVEVALQNGYGTNEAHFRVNEGEFNG